MPATVYIDAGEFLETAQELAHYYAGFPWESRIWAASGHRRSPFRTLLLFGLSPRTRDGLLVDQSQRLFALCSDAESFVAIMRDQPGAVSEIVRKGQWPFIQSAAEFLRDYDGIIPRDADQLQAIKGVGEKIAECVLGYGFGKEALPVDGHVYRVAVRMFGFAGNFSATELRGELKRIFQEQRCRFHNLGLAMIDLHEILRLHGQVVCAKAPKCAVCPISSCAYRSLPFAGASDTSVSANYWQDWRELLLEP
ncbi:MAG: endonuclease III domain-containing protein [Dehalococcoidia bacterium]